MAGGVVREVLAVAALLESPVLAQVYTAIAQAGVVTRADVLDELAVTHRGVDEAVQQLVDVGAVVVITDEPVERYAARQFAVTVTSAGGHAYTITPALIAAVGRRRTNADLDIFVKRHGIPALATALSHAIARERGTSSHRELAAALDIPSFTAELILEALRPVVHAHHDIPDTSPARGRDAHGDQSVDPT